MGQVAESGVRMTKFGKSEKEQALEMFAEAALEAVADCNLTVKDIQALFFGTVYDGFAEGQMNISAHGRGGQGTLTFADILKWPEHAPFS